MNNRFFLPRNDQRYALFLRQRELLVPQPEALFKETSPAQLPIKTSCKAVPAFGPVHCDPSPVPSVTKRQNEALYHPAGSNSSTRSPGALSVN